MRLISNYINDSFNLNNTGISNAVDTKDLPRHRWYYYKEGFSPTLVKTAIETYNLHENNIIIDPFNGSGTVTLSAASNNIKSYGFEINPFTSFLAKTKTLNEEPEHFQSEVDEVVDYCRKGTKSRLEGYSTFTESKANTTKWLFSLDVIRTFEGGFNYISNKKSKSSKLLKLALISSAMDNCNAYKDGKCLRYKKNWEKVGYSKDTFLEAFISKCKTIKEDLNEEVPISPCISTYDSRRRKSNKTISKFDLCITSPPYLNTFDYTDIYRPELFLGGFVNSSKELYNLRFKTVRSHVQVKWKQPNVDKIESIQLKNIYKKIIKKKHLLMNNYIPSMILAYFEDMGKVFSNLSNYANNKANLWMIVSTSAYANEHIPVDLILADISTINGWKLHEIGVLREIRKRKTKYSPNIIKLRESVIILEKK